MTLVVVSGGQTGVDRAALEAARALGLPIAGWCPAGGWAEDLPDPPGVLGRYPELRPTPSGDPAERTRLNVRDSDATLVVVPDGDWASAGTELAVTTARLFGRPLLVVPVTEQEALTAWLAGWADQGSSARLNIVGPRESEVPGMTSRATALLTDAFVTLR